MSAPTGSPSGSESALTNALICLAETGIGKTVREVIGDSQLDFSSLSLREQQLVIAAIAKGYLKWFLVEKIQNIPLYGLCKSGLSIAVRNEEMETIFLSHSSQIPKRDHTAQMFWKEANFEINFSQKKVQIIPSNERFIARDLDKAEVRISLPSTAYLKDFLECMIEDGFFVFMETPHIVLSRGEDIITFIEKCTQQ